jgi:hypothetical protein
MSNTKALNNTLKLNTNTSTNTTVPKNNLNSRIKSVESNIKNNITTLQNKKVSNIPLTQRLQTYTKGFTNAVLGKKNNTNTSTSNNNTSTPNNNNKTNKDASPFDNPLLLLVILLIAVGFISYGIYKYYSSLDKVLYGKSYYGSDILNYNPLFTITVPKIEKCIDRCNKDSLCNGITYNDTTMQCLGTSKGVLRSDTIEHQAWVKPITDKLEPTSMALIGLADSRQVVKKEDMPYPVLAYEFNYSFYIYIDDFYVNQGTWKHIFHKGADIPVNVAINTKNWNDIEADYPDQSVGVWVAPFNNNIRIALTTIKTESKTHTQTPYEHAYKQEFIINENKVPEVFISDKPNNPMRDNTIDEHKLLEDTDTNLYSRKQTLEYIDIYRIPVKQLVHISINVLGLTLEVYINGNLYKIHELQGYPMFNNGDLYIMNKASIDGSIYDLKYTPARLTHNVILTHINNKESLETKIQKGIKGLNL